MEGVTESLSPPPPSEDIEDFAPLSSTRESHLNHFSEGVSIIDDEDLETDSEIETESFSSFDEHKDLEHLLTLQIEPPIEVISKEKA